MSATAASYSVVGFQTGLNWRSLAFEKPPPAIRVCSLCGVVPRTTLVLPCSHAFCEPCFAATEGKGRVCPLDGHAYDQDTVGRLQLPPDQVLRLRAACWNPGCCFVGPVSGLLEHFEEHCAFHRVSCNRCHQDVLRHDLVQHYAEGCSSATSVQGGGSREAGLLCSDILKASAEFRRSFTELRDGYYELQASLNTLSGEMKHSRSETNAAAASVSRLLQAELAALKAQLEALQCRGTGDVPVPAPTPTPEPVPREPRQLSDALYIIGSSEEANASLESGGIRSDDPQRARRALWSVSNMASLCAQASRCGQTLSCSDVFSLDGYMARLEIHLRCVDCVLFVRPCFRLCRGANDAVLEWPFKKTLSVKLAHFQRQGVSVRFDLDTGHMGDYREFWMPTRERNIPFTMCEMTLLTTAFSAGSASTLDIFLELLCRG
ncbi:uncharacterized protein LOC8052203 [Ixodes scapularis]|uniref:uncharacterized protein LOC8052203 n=1 Tax=Ixodes scapularis TaxID=6945 RepID=UPI001A9DD671|nr:uncharacterized protein LOC8052203 [Ixodes scapularis]